MKKGKKTEYFTGSRVGDRTYREAVPVYGAQKTETNKNM